MDPLTSVALAAASFFVLCWVVRRAVASGIADAAARRQTAPASSATDGPED
jgi:hypothetical protein